MDERPEDHREPEAGTTLAELLVVIVLLTIVGGLTTVGIVSGFNAQLDATNVAETLDGMRIATQRVREYVRGADEVCASSTATSLVLWTDDDGDGVVNNPEIDIFELAGPAGDKVFRRRVPGGGGEVQLIRDDIIDETVFTYPTGSATNQPPSLICEDGATLTSPGTSLVRSVTIQFEVEHPDPAESNNLETTTVVQVRNAGLLDDPREAPTAAFTSTCSATSTDCTFDASTSTDTDGLVVEWIWDFGDGTTGSGETVSHSFPAEDTDYEVRLTAVDNDGVSDTDTQTVRSGTAGNAKPVASYTYTCTGRQCDFDASATTDDSGIASYAWDFGDGTTATDTLPTASHTYLNDDTYVVELIVTDDDPATPLTDSESQAVTASTAAVRVDSLTGTGTPVSASNTWEATVTIQLGFTTSGEPGAGITISGRVQIPGNNQDVSCSTDSDGKCSVTVAGIDSGQNALYSVTSVEDTSGSVTYDKQANKADKITVTKNSTVSAP